MDRELVVSVDHEDTRVAVLEDGRLVEIYLERPLTQRTVGNIYKGRVENVLPGMQAAFVNIGLEKNAFLFVDDAYPARNEELDEAVLEDVKKHSIKDLVKEGQEVIVQVAKEPTGTKGARVTRNLTIPGRYLVLMPTGDFVGVSRRIGEEKERERLKGIARQVKPRRLGVIVRTAAEGHSKQEILEDVRFLRRSWARLRQKARKAKAPVLLYKDLGLVHRILRDQLSEEIRAITVDNPQEYQRVLETLDAFAPEMKDRVRLWQDKNKGLFEAYQIEEEIEKALQRKVWLKSGGYLVIDQTEALTAIDVNTGKYVGQTNLEDTIYKTNLEATGEIARQIRLRDIGGIIIIDFIDMEQPRHRQKVVKALEDYLKADRTKSTILGITQLGLVEMTRKKGRQNLLHLITRPCPYCEGSGRVLTEESMSRKARREIKRILHSSNSEAILVEVHPSVASLLIGPGGSNLKELERDTGRSIYVKGSEHCHLEEMNVRALGDKGEVEEQALPVRTGQVLELKVEEPHVSNSWDGIARVEGYVIDIEGAGSRVGERIKVEITRAFRTYAKARILQDRVG